MTEQRPTFIKIRSLTEHSTSSAISFPPSNVRLANYTSRNLFECQLSLSLQKTRAIAPNMAHGHGLPGATLHMMTSPTVQNRTCRRTRGPATVYTIHVTDRGRPIQQGASRLRHDTSVAISTAVRWPRSATMQK